MHQKKEDVASPKQTKESAFIEIVLLQDDPSEIQRIRSSISRCPRFRVSKILHDEKHLIDHGYEMVKSERQTIFIIDLDCLKKNKASTIRQLRESVKETDHLLMLSNSKEHREIITTIKAGASAYLLKANTDQLVKYLEELALRGGVLDQDIVWSIVDRLFKKNRAKYHSSTCLSERELQVLEHLANGYQKKEISSCLSISPSTVSTHVRHIYEKLEVANAAAAVRKAYELGLFVVE